MKKILPVVIPPIISYQNRAHPLSVTFCYKETLPWFYNNFIQVKYTNVSSQSNTMAYDFIAGSVFSGIPWLDFVGVRRITTVESEVDIIDQIIQFLDNEYYYYCYIDEYFIPNRSAYQQYHMEHDVLVHGYDLNDKSFHIIGFNDKHDYACSKVGFEDFSKAFYTLKTDPDIFTIPFKKAETCGFKFDIQLVKKMLIDYLCSKDVSEELDLYLGLAKDHGFLKYLNRVLKTNDTVYGLNTYGRLKAFSESIFNGTGEIDIRQHHCFWEHKYCMLQRIRFLQDEKYLDRQNQLYEAYEEVEQKALSIRNAMIKYFLTNDTDLAQEVLPVIDELQDKEYAILTELAERI